MGEPLDRSLVLARGTGEQVPPAVRDEELDLEGASDPALGVEGPGIIRAVNRHAERLLGRARGELIGTAVESVLACEDPRVLATPVRGVSFVPAGTVHAINARGDRLVTAMTVCANGGDRRVLLLRAFGPERSSLDEDDLAEIVHDLRGPLSAIALEAHLLGECAGRGETVARIERNTSYMDRLVSDILDLCAADAGRLSLDLDQAELGEVVMRVVQRLSTVDGARVQVDRPATAVSFYDERRIERVLANLVDNALKYSPPRSPVTVRVRTAASRATVSVIDAGPGLAPADAAAVFEKYRRAPTAQGRTGSGLGLYVCRRIIEQHGGTLRVHSEVGAGSRFEFDLPRDAPSWQAREPWPDSARNRRVLIVDDDPVQADSLAVILTDDGFDTEVAHTAAEALLRARARRPHVLVADARLRGTSGIELLFRLHDELGPIPSIVLTGLPCHDAGVTAACRTLGASYLAKPVDLAQLRALLTPRT